MRNMLPKHYVTVKTTSGCYEIPEPDDNLQALGRRTRERASVELSQLRVTLQSNRTDGQGNLA